MPYHYTQNGRSLYTILITGGVSALAVLFLVLPSPIFTVLGIGLIILACSGIYAFVKGETWSMRVEDGVLSWSYARWPKSFGRIDLSSVRHVVVNDRSSSLLFTFLDGSSRKIKLIGYAGRFRDYLVAHYPSITVEFVEGT